MNMSSVEVLVDRVAELAHEANRGYCTALGDTSQMAWADAPENIKNSARAGVRFIMNNPATTPEQSHESWLAFKKADGFVYGEVKDLVAKTHPCMVPYADLPVEQKAKDYIFRAVVKTALAQSAV